MLSLAVIIMNINQKDLVILQLLSFETNTSISNSELERVREGGGEERHAVDAITPHPRGQGQGEERRPVDAINTIIRCPRDRPQRHRRHRTAPSTPPTGGSAAGNVILSYRFLFNCIWSIL